MKLEMEKNLIFASPKKGKVCKEGCNSSNEHPFAYYLSMEERFFHLRLQSQPCK